MNESKNFKKRAIQYWFNDGLNEIGIGIVFLILAGYFYLESTIQKTGFLRLVLDISLILIILGSFYLVNQGIRYFKENLTYPRTGYVSYQRNRKLPRWLTGLIAGIIGALVAGLIIRGNLMNWLAALTGIFLSLVFIFLAFRVGLLRFHILALLLLGTGFALSSFNIDPTLGTSAVYFVGGVFVMLSGLITLFTYLRHTDKPDIEVHE